MYCQCARLYNSHTCITLLRSARIPASVSALQLWALPPPNARSPNWPMRDPFWKHDTSCDWPMTGSGLNTDYTPCRHTFQGCFSGYFPILSISRASFHQFWPTQFTFWPTCRFARRRAITSEVNIRFIWGATRCCRLAVLRPYWPSNIQSLMWRRLHRRKLNTGERV